MSRSRMKTLSLALAITLGAAACGSDADPQQTSTGVATLEDPTDTQDTENSGGAENGDAAATDETDGHGTTDDGVEAPDDPELAMALFEQCMADNGFQISIGGGDDAGISISESLPEEDSGQDIDSVESIEDFEEAFEEVQEQCDQHFANVDNSFEMSPELEAEFEDAQLEWSACMADKGFDIPVGGSGSITIEVEGEGGDPQNGVTDLAEFDEANEECNKVFDALNEAAGAVGNEGE